MSINMKNTQLSRTVSRAAPPGGLDSAKGTLADRVTGALYEQIRQGDFAPGARMPSENELTERFQVSRTVIREAISRLKSEGLVGSRRGSGTVVLAPNNATPFRLDIDVQDSIQVYRQKWGTTLGDYLRGPQQNLRFLLPLVYRNPVMTSRLAEAILSGKSVVR